MMAELDLEERVNSDDLVKKVCEMAADAYLPSCVFVRHIGYSPLSHLFLTRDTVVSTLNYCSVVSFAQVRRMNSQIQHGRNATYEPGL